MNGHFSLEGYNSSAFKWKEEINNTADFLLIKRKKELNNSNNNSNNTSANTNNTNIQSSCEYEFILQVVGNDNKLEDYDRIYVTNTSFQGSYFG
jgi:hypothetical protein